MLFLNLLQGQNVVSHRRRNDSSRRQAPSSVKSSLSSFAPQFEPLEDRTALSAMSIVDTEVLQAGDVNHDSQFDQQDIVQVLQAGSYMSGESASWSEGDWNQDEVFNQLDIVKALQAGDYQQGPEAGDANGDSRFDQADIVQVLQAGKFSTDQPATFAEGDWNRRGL